MRDAPFAGGAAIDRLYIVQMTTLVAPGLPGLGDSAEEMA